MYLWGSVGSSSPSPYRNGKLVQEAMPEDEETEEDEEKEAPRPRKRRRGGQ